MRSEFASCQIQVEAQRSLLIGYQELSLEETELYKEADEQLKYLEALLTLSEGGASSANAALESSYVSLLKVTSNLTQKQQI